jgi:tetratricopeptide (TPR) repeat protein
MDAGREEEAQRHYREVFRLVPTTAHRSFDPTNAFSPAGESARIPGQGTVDDSGRKRAEEAVDRFRRELLANPRSVAAANGLGTALVEAGRLEEALAVFQAGERDLPHVAGLSFNAGIVLTDLGRLEEAAAAFRRAVAVDPRFAQAHNNLGSTLERLGRNREALDHFREAVRIAPGDPVAQGNLERLQRETANSE